MGFHYIDVNGQPSLVDREFPDHGDQKGLSIRDWNSDVTGMWLHSDARMVETTFAFAGGGFNVWSRHGTTRIRGIIMNYDDSFNRERTSHDMTANNRKNLLNADATGSRGANPSPHLGSSDLRTHFCFGHMRMVRMDDGWTGWLRANTSNHALFAVIATEPATTYVALTSDRTAQNYGAEFFDRWPN